MLDERSGASEVKQDEETLSNDEEQIEIALDVASLALWDWNLLTNKIETSSNFKKLLGLTQNSPNGSYQSLLNSVHPEDKEHVSQTIARTIAEGHEYTDQFRIVWPDGTVRWIMSKGRVFRDEAGKAVRLLGSSMDITESKKAEEERVILAHEEAARASLEASEENYRLMAEALPQQVWTTKPDGTIDYVNQRMFDYFGLQKEAIRDKLWRELIHPDDLPLSAEGWQHALKTGEAYEAELRLKRASDKTYRWHLTRAIPVYDAAGRIIKWLGTSTDIHDKKRTEELLRETQAELEKRVEERTAQLKEANLRLREEIREREQAEKALRESEERYRELFENANDIIYTHDLEGRFTSLNKTGERITGYTRDEAIRMSIDQVVSPEYLDQAREMIASKLEKGVSTVYELEIFTKDGRKVMLELSTRLVYKGDKPIGVQGIARDITERKQVEAALTRSEEQFRYLFESNMIGIGFGNIAGAVTKANDALLKIIGYTREDLESGKINWRRMTSAEYSHLDDRAIEESRRFGRSTPFEKEYVRKDGTRIPVMVGGALSIGSKDEGVFFALDLSDRKAAEEALRKSEERFQLAAHATNDAIYDFNLLKDELWWNKGVETLFGYAPSDVGPDLAWWTKQLHPEDAERVNASLDAAIKSGKEFWSEEYRFRRADGSYAYVFDRGFIVHDNEGRPSRMIGAMIDITDRKLAEEAVRQSEERYRTLIEQASDGIFIIDAEGNYLDLNTSACELLGRSRKEILRMNVRDMLLPEDVSAAGPALQAVREGKATLTEWQIKRKDGTLIPVEISAKLLPDGSIQGIARNITERKRAEAALRESEERYRELVENALDIIYTHDLQGHYTSLNKAGERITGYTREEVKTMTFADILAPDQIEFAREMIRKKLEGLDQTTYEIEIVSKDGRRIALEVSSRLVYQNGVLVGVQGIARDVTDRKHLEEQLRQAQKMEAVGRLAGGIAHDFNNLLTAIMGQSGLLMRHIKPDDPLQRKVTEIRKAGERASALTRQLLAFSRKQLVQVKVFCINQVVKEMDNLLRHLIGEDIELVTTLDPNLGQVKADPSQIEQVIMNLAVNARDAMPLGGTLTIKTANIILSEKRVRERHSIERSGPYVMLMVRDTGAGMDAETQKHIFEPFFTTKDVGKGTGLGLSTVFGIIKQTDGFIEVESQPEKGATFRIYLPRVNEIISTPVTEQYSLVNSSQGEEVVLLVEDDSLVRDLTREVLETNGYTVFEASDAEEAQKFLRQYKGRIDLLLTDVIMPRMSGYQLAEWLKPLRPDVRVLFMSGYTADAIGQHGVLDERVAFIQKPFMPDALISKIREVLDAQADDSSEGENS